MRRKTRKNQLINSMNVVPYIDVMLVLLVIFIVTVPIFVPGVINLPRVGQADKITQQPIEINISKDLNYSISQNNKTLTVSNLNNLINQVVHMSTNQTPVVVSADKTIEYDAVINVVDKLYSVGIKKVALVVKDKNG
jgi:biopolymer transport protein TolR